MYYVGPTELDMTRSDYVGPTELDMTRSDYVGPTELDMTRSEFVPSRTCPKVTMYRIVAVSNWQIMCPHVRVT